MPIAYWLDKPYLTSHIMLIAPSESEFDRVSTAVKKARKGEYDMDIINKLYRKTCILLDHKRYALLTGEFRETNHVKYLSGRSSWDPLMVLKDASFVHFSDYPLPKPWLHLDSTLFERIQPRCTTTNSQESDCTARDIWLELYRDFRERKAVSHLQP
jgi:hypothetical protein